MATDLPAGRGTRAEWAAVIAECQGLVNTATALQDAAITRVAAIEDDLLEDGTRAESHRVLGHVSLDAPDVVAGALGVTHNHAERRVALAVRLVAAGHDDGDSGLVELHAAMLEGGLDAYRAAVVAEELEEAPPHVAAAVVGALAPRLGAEPAARLRQRCRRALARISPDLLHERARRARERCGLRRWVQEPGADRWDGTFPSEQAAEGWAVVDGLAHRYVAEGRCRSVEQARALALMDLIRGQATIDVELVVTVPAAALPASGERDGSALDQPGRAGVTSLSRVRLRSPDEPDRPRLRASRAGASRAPRVDGLPPEVVAGAACGSTDEATPGPDEGAASGGGEAAAPAPVGGEGTVPAMGAALTDGSLRPGASSARGGAQRDLGSTEREGRPSSGRSFLEVSGPFPGDPVLVDRGWVAALVGETAERGPSGSAPQGARELTVRRRSEECDPSTGALLGCRHPQGRGYRPGGAMAASVRARDGRCRFPGCAVAVRFCDLDHVRPWPGGPTSPANLLCLCRRHHRVKQRAGWSVRLLPDARAVWTDPTGRVRTTWPRDLLTPVLLLDPGPGPAPDPTWPRDLLTPVVRLYAGPGPAADATGGPHRHDDAARPAGEGGEPGCGSPEYSSLETLLGVRLEHALEDGLEHEHEHEQERKNVPSTAAMTRSSKWPGGRCAGEGDGKGTRLDLRWQHRRRVQYADGSSQVAHEWQVRRWAPAPASASDPALPDQPDEPPF